MRPAAVTGWLCAAWCIAGRAGVLGIRDFSPGAIYTVYLPRCRILSCHRLVPAASGVAEVSRAAWAWPGYYV